MNVRMKRNAGRLAAGGAVACIVVSALHGSGWIPFWVFAAIVVLAFPVTVLALFLWWMAAEGKEDIPFIGY
jgi:hypothetical protein